MNANVRRIMFAAIVLLTFGIASQASAQSVVGTCATGTATYTTIQQAVNASPSGTVIEICPGNYPEQVTITKSLTLMGVEDPSTGENAAVIVSPAGGVTRTAFDFDNNSFPIAAQVLVQGTFGIPTQVTLQDLAVDGAGNALNGCGTDIAGILFQNASGTVQNVATRNQTLIAADAGCQDGEGIFVETQSKYGFSSAVTVQNSSVHDYQKNGITGNDLGTSMTITSNSVRGWGATPAIAQNGIQLCCGATGTITSNSVIDDVYTGPNFGSSGILLFDTLENGGISVSTNTIGNTQFPVVVFTDEFAANQYGDGVTILSNQIFGALTFDAIDVCTNGNTVKKNTITNSTESAIHLDASCSGSGNNTGNNNTVIKNVINEGECAGILSDSGTTNTTPSLNTFNNVTFQTASSTASCSPAPAAAASIRSKGTERRPQPMIRRVKK